MLISATVSNLSGFCNSIILYRILVVIKKSLTIIQIVGPIFCMIALFVNFTKGVINPEETENHTVKKKIQNTLIATAILFFIPALVNLLMSLPPISQNTTVGECWAAVDATGKRIK